ncbi:MAG: EAL domain-containing protein [Aphanothece sp. CMT-3BRIN-NPC111]|nr:EAL domain-containing protein [Aphanothece sp. CMT-3BRIN-NPC111]
MPLTNQSTTPSQDRQTRIVLVVEDTKGKRRINLDKNIYSLGRDSKTSIVLHSQHVSRHHATLFRIFDTETNTYLFQLIDGDLQGNRSTNGVTVNGQFCFSKTLKHKDLISFAGKVKAWYLAIDFELSDSALFEYCETGTLLDSSAAIFDPFETLVSSENEFKPLDDPALLRLASFPELLPSPIIEIDLTGKITYLNPAAIISFPDLQEAHRQHSILEGVLDAVQNERQQFFVREIEMGNAIFEQSVYYIPELSLIRSYLVDITQRKHEEKELQQHRENLQQLVEALRESEERYALAARAANDGLWDWNVKTHEIYYSPRWKSMLGFEENEIGNSSDEWFNRVHPQEVERVKVELSVLAEGITSHFKSEYRMLHKDGTYRWMLSQGIALKNSDANVYRMAGSQTDVTGRKVAEAQLLHDALHDALTGLSNRVLFMDRLAHAVEIAKRRQDYLFAVLFLDLDRFKVINDSLGHLKGDQLLITLAKRLLPCVRSGDTVARLGGDEFAILLDDIQEIQDAKDIAEKIKKQLALPFPLSDQEVFTSGSIGIALSTTGYDRPEDVLRDADIAMYTAKAQGKARYEVFHPSMHIKAVTRLQLENDLRRAIERQEFVIHYQPIVALSSGQITGFEALIRWHHPSGSVVTPDDFIPVAEETGLIVPIGYWVLREACRQLWIWQQSFNINPPLTMSVNISGKQFREADLLEQIQEIILDAGINPSTLKLEITESSIMEDTKATEAMLVQLRKLGVQIYIDDFGTGYSSLSYLHQFPLDALKIDRSFITRLCNGGESSELVQTMINLAHSLGIYVVAEGVETVQQRERLKEMDSQGGQGQGYYFSKPLDSVGVEALMAQQPQW